MKKKNFINVVYGVLSKGLLSNKFVLQKKSLGIKRNINYSKMNIKKIKSIFNICRRYDYSLEEFMYSLINYQKYVDIVLCGITSMKYFKTTNFEKILNKKMFQAKFNDMKKYEEIKDIL